jgi:hypothetical protein
MPSPCSGLLRITCHTGTIAQSQTVMQTNHFKRLKGPIRDGLSRGLDARRAAYLSLEPRALV